MLSAIKKVWTGLVKLGGWLVGVLKGRKDSPGPHIKIGDVGPGARVSVTIHTSSK